MKRRLISLVLVAFMVMTASLNTVVLADEESSGTVTGLTYSNGCFDNVSVHGFDADTLSYNITIPQGKDANAAASSVKAIMSDATQVSAVANGNVATVSAGGKTYSVAFAAAENEYRVINGHSVWGTDFEYSSTPNPNTENFAVADGVKVGSYATASTASNRIGDEFVYSKIDASLLGSSVIKMWKGGGAIASYSSSSGADYPKRFYTDSYDGQDGKPYYIEFELTNPATVMFFGYYTGDVSDPWPAGTAQGWTYKTYNANTAPIKSKSGGRAPAYSFEKSFAAGETVQIPNWGETVDTLTSKNTGLNYWHYGFYIVWDDISNANAASLSYSVDGQSYSAIPDFDKDKLLYKVKVPESTNTVTLEGDVEFKRLLSVWEEDGVNSDTATISYDRQTVDLSDADSASITATVTARDTKTTKDYVVNFVKNSYDGEEWFIRNSLVLGNAYGTKNLVSVSDSSAVTKALSVKCTEKPGSASNFGVVSEIDKTEVDEINAGEDYLLSFYVKAVDVSGTLIAELLDESGNVVDENSSCKYYTSGQWTRISMPFTATGTENSVKISLGDMTQQVLIGGVDIKKDTLGFKKNDSGYHMEPSNWTKTELGWTEGTVGTGSVDTLLNGDYLYSLSPSDKKIFIYSIAENKAEPRLVNSVEAVESLRKLALSDDGKTLVAVARGYSSYIYDLTDPVNPVFTSRLDTLELATGVDIEGDYCFIADRIYGVSIYDISDKYNPKAVSALHLSECQDVTVHDGYMYAGVWGACKVRVCDVRDVTNPIYLRDILLDGRGDGVTVRGNYLYAATGHMGPGATLGTPAYGLGNGLEIYDISDPANPVRKSVSKLEGRLYHNWNDFWKVTVTDDDKVFLSSTYNGLYIFDVTDKSLPTRLASIHVVAKNGETGYTNLDTRDTFVFPFDPSLESRAAAVDCNVADGYLYMSFGGLRVYDATDITLRSTQPDDSTVELQNSGNDFFDEDFESMGFENVKVFKPAGQVWASARYGNYTYVAAGTDGIYVIDDNFEVKAHYPSQDITMDIQIYGNVIYTAESCGGLCTYVIDSEDPTKITFAASTKDVWNVAVRQLQLSPGAKFALAQTDVIGAIFNVTDIYNPTLYKKLNYTMVYQKQLSIGASANRYLILFANGSNTVVCDFGENGSYDEPVVDTSWATSGLGQGYGLCADGDYMFAQIGGALCWFDPSDTSLYTQSLKANPNITKYTVNGKVQQGCPTVLGDRAFVSGGRNGQLFILDITNRNSEITVDKSVTFKGNPGVATNVGNRVYLPLGYSGLLSFTYDGVGTNDTENKTDLTVSASGNGTVKVNGENKLTGADDKYAIGTAITLEAVAGENAKFAYWVDKSSNRIVSTEATYEFTLGEVAKIYEAVFVSTGTDVKVVIFKNKNGQILQNESISEGAAVIVPENPTYMGYAFKGWLNNGNDAGESVVAGASLEYTALEAENIFTPKFEKGTDEYTIAITGGTITTDGDTFLYDTSVTVQATGEEGKVFSHWTKNGVTVSYDEVYTFYVSGNTTLVANYVDAGSAPTAVPIVSMYATQVLLGNNRIAFFSERNLPYGYTYVGAGIILKSGDKTANSGLTLETEGALIANSTSGKANGQYVIRKAGLVDGDTWSARAFLTYKDSADKIHTIYSAEVVDGTYSD